VRQASKKTGGSHQTIALPRAHPIRDEIGYNKTMGKLSFFNDIKHSKIGKMPMVILPLGDYEKMKEDLEMFHSKKLLKDIKKSREEIKKGMILTLDQVKRKLKIA